MARYIDADKAVELIKNYGKGAISDGQATLDPVDDIVLLAKGIDLIPTADVVEVDRVAEMFVEQFGDKCPCNFNDNAEWLSLYCEYTNTCDCPCKDGWKQFIKHYGKRKEGDTR